MQLELRCNVYWLLLSVISFAFLFSGHVTHTCVSTVSFLAHGRLRRIARQISRWELVSGLYRNCGPIADRNFSDLCRWRYDGMLLMLTEWGDELLRSAWWIPLRHRVDRWMINDTTPNRHPSILSSTISSLLHSVSFREGVRGLNPPLPYFDSLLARLLSGPHNYSLAPIYAYNLCKYNSFFAGSSHARFLC